MKKVLFVDCCMREESRTRILANSFLESIEPEIELTHLELTKLDLKPLVNEFYHDREVILKSKNLNHPRFKYAHQLSQADEVIVAAPFWDLTFPALLKIYIENCTVDGITFKSSEDGLEGICKANNLFYLTTRGGFYTDNPMEQAFPHMNAIAKFFGIKNFYGLAADGMDVKGFDSKKSLDEACEKARKLAKKI